MCAMNLQSEERLLARDEWLAVIASRRDRCRRVHPSCINSQPGGPCLLTSVEALQSISRIDGIDRLSLCITPSKPGATVWARARNLAARCGFSNSGCGVSVAPTPLQRGHNAKLPGGACNGVSSKNRRSPLLGGTGRLAERQPERRFAAQGGAAAPRRTRPNVCSESCPACRRSGTCRRPRTSGAEGQQIITLLQNDVQEQGGGGGEAEGRRGTTGHRAAGDSGPAPAVQPAGGRELAHPAGDGGDLGHANQQPGASNQPPGLPRHRWRWRRSWRRATMHASHRRPSGASCRSACAMPWRSSPCCARTILRNLDTDVRLANPVLEDTKCCSEGVRAEHKAVDSRRGRSPGPRLPGGTRQRDETSGRTRSDLAEAQVRSAGAAYEPGACGRPRWQSTRRLRCPCAQRSCQLEQEGQQRAAEGEVRGCASASASCRRETRGSSRRWPSHSPRRMSAPCWKRSWRSRGARWPSGPGKLWRWPSGWAEHRKPWRPCARRSLTPNWTATMVGRTDGRRAPGGGRAGPAGARPEPARRLSASW
uniref:Uncharacterized protein LOC116945813 isoform X3 n=2 Tax=Petromyzon marinus TaxID=7757 RepID=A0AAJ7TE32_PETMA|nr:uncharacterized protein LOC116945813 isoform X3 [Petromyzon marinus]